MSKIHVVIDAVKNRVLYAVLSFGFMGMGNKLFAMPWEVFEFSANLEWQAYSVLRVSPEEMPAIQPAI